MSKLPKEMNEIELYFFIDACGGFIWRMNHDMGHGRIPESDHAAIDQDIIKVREKQMEAVYELPRIGVLSPLDEHQHPTEEYWAWFRSWDAWKKNLSDDAWREADESVSRGLTEEELAQYKLEAFSSKG